MNLKLKFKRWNFLRKLNKRLKKYETNAHIFWESHSPVIPELMCLLKDRDNFTHIDIMQEEFDRPEYIDFVVRQVEMKVAVDGEIQN